MAILRIHTLQFNPIDWMELTNKLSQLERFDAEWRLTEKREKATLKELKSMATVRSIGASTRIEGSKLSDTEVETLIGNLDITKLAERDEQEVAGYYETLNLISESYRDISVTENSIKHLHNVLMKYSAVDSYHRGQYKKNSNQVVRNEPGSDKPIVIFQTTPPGWQTEDTMRQLIEWYNNDTTTNTLIRTAIFAYEFLSIHPFQDGNGRLSRLLTMLLLLKNGYRWIEYVSFEHEIENRKKEYYRTLMEAQRHRPGEDVTQWVDFFLNCLQQLQLLLTEKVTSKKRKDSINIREQQVLNVIENRPGINSSSIAKRLNIPSPTVKRILSEMVKKNLLIQHGLGRGTRYSVAVIDSIKRDITIRLTDTERIAEFALQHPGSFIRIRKIVLVPKFEWKHPDEWSRLLYQNGLAFTIRCVTSKNAVFEQYYAIANYNDPNYFQPVFIVTPNIVLPDQLDTNQFFKLDYPLKGTISLIGSVPNFDFDVMLITDEG